MNLTESQKKSLRGLAHALKPIVMVAGGGASEGVINELDQALAHHELLKIRVRVGDREARDELIGQLCRKTRATLVQRVGNVATLFRRNPEKPKIKLPS
ncbi:MAG: ribosome assembly RNA-binding protein YhbY [Chromatiales bacterium]|nr:ribosome assembly RNA-binding protein YhbY [Chromatiales bacterium]